MGDLHVCLRDSFVVLVRTIERSGGNTSGRSRRCVGRRLCCGLCREVVAARVGLGFWGVRGEDCWIR